MSVCVQDGLKIRSVASPVGREISTLTHTHTPLPKGDQNREWFSHQQTLPVLGFVIVMCNIFLSVKTRNLYNRSVRAIYDTERPSIKVERGKGDINKQKWTWGVKFTATTVSECSQSWGLEDLRFGTLGWIVIHLILNYDSQIQFCMQMQTSLKFWGGKRSHFLVHLTSLQMRKDRENAAEKLKWSIVTSIIHKVEKIIRSMICLCAETPLHLCRDHYQPSNDP